MPTVEREAVALVLSAAIECLDHREIGGRVRHVVDIESLEKLVVELQTMHDTQHGDAKELYDAIALLREFLLIQSDQNEIFDSLFPPR